MTADRPIGYRCVNMHFALLLANDQPQNQKIKSKR
jgi:hypothetical protein